VYFFYHKIKIFKLNLIFSKRIVSINSSCHTSELINDSSPISFIQEDDIYRMNKLNEITHLVNNEISILMKHFNPFYQNELDEKLR